MSFTVHKLEIVSSNIGKVNFEVLVHLLSYIKENNTVGLKYYSDMKDSHLSDLSIQANIKTDNQLMAFYDYICQYFPDTGRSTREYIIFYQGGPIDHGTRAPGPVDQPSTESDYNAAYKSGMALENFRMLIHEFLNKDPDIVPE